MNEEKKQPAQADERAQALSYLLRFWRDNAQQPWRATVKSIANGLEMHFSTPEKLFLFLHEQMTHGAEQEPPPHLGETAE